MGLSERRANAVRKYLEVALPEMPASIHIQPFGETRSRREPAEWANDRRVDVKLTMITGGLGGARLGFTFDENSKVAGIISKSLEKKEIDQGGSVVACDENGLHSNWKEHVDMAGKSKSRFSAVVGAISFERYKKESLRRVTAYVETECEFDGAGGVHVITTRVRNPTGPGVLFSESIKASSIGNGPTTVGLVGKVNELYDRLRGGSSCITLRLERSGGPGVGAQP